MKKTRKMTAYDIFSLVIAAIAALLFGAAFIGCYVLLFTNFSLVGLVATFLASLIPGLICHGIVSSAVEFIRGDSYTPRRTRRYRKKESDSKVNEVLSLIFMLLAIILFGGLTIGVLVYAFLHFSVASLLASALVAIIPGLICYACISATMEYIKNNLSKK